MGRLKTHEEFVAEVFSVNPNVEILGEYIRATSKIKCMCKLDGFIWDASCNHLIEGHGCPKCCGNLQLSHDGFVERMRSINSNIIFLNTYKNNKTKIHCRCKIDGFEWHYKASNLLSGKCKCPQCKNKINWNTDSFIKRLQSVNKDIEYLSGNYKNNSSRFKLECLKCEKVWESSAMHLLAGHSCPRCNYSIGEKRVQLFLENNQINFETQKKYDDLIGCGNGLLSYDFYIPKYNILIEFNGIQHYIPTNHFGGVDYFKIQKEHDKRKKNYALHKNIDLLVIGYYDCDNVEEILSNILK